MKNYLIIVSTIITLSACSAQAEELEHSNFTKELKKSLEYPKFINELGKCKNESEAIKNINSHKHNSLSDKITDDDFKTNNVKNRIIHEDYMNLFDKIRSLLLDSIENSNDPSSTMIQFYLYKSNVHQLNTIYTELGNIKAILFQICKNQSNTGECFTNLSKQKNR
jgi:hypothetical protein